MLLDAYILTHELSGLSSAKLGLRMEKVFESLSFRQSARFSSIPVFLTLRNFYCVTETGLFTTSVSGSQFRLILLKVLLDS